MKKFPTALQLYSVRDTMEQSFEKTLQEVSKMGYDGVEFAGLFGKTGAEVKELCQEYGLIPISAHVPLSEMLADPNKVFSTYKEVGCPFIAVPYLGTKDRPGKENYDQTVENIALLAKKAIEYDIHLMYHNHDFEFVRLNNGKYGFDDLYGRIPTELLYAEIDTCWVNVAGEDPSDYVRRYSGRVPILHLKDFVMPGKKPTHLYSLIGLENEENTSEEAFSFRPVGYGVQNIPAILNAATDADCQWVVVEQDETALGKTSMECAELSINYLKNLYN